MKKIILMAGLLTIGSYSFASQINYECSVYNASVTSPFEKIKGPLNLIISQDANGKSSLELLYGKRNLMASHYNANLYVSKKQNFYNGGDKPEFVNITLDPALYSAELRGKLHLNPKWPNFESDDYLYCEKK